MNGSGDLVLADGLVCLYTYSKILILMIVWLGPEVVLTGK